MTHPARKQAPAARLPTGVAVIAIVAIALLAFANAWPNALVYDDKYFAGKDLFTYLNTGFRYFSTDVWSLAGVKSQLYRPVLLLSLGLDAQLYGDWFAGYHLTNLLLNALASLLVFGLLRELLRRYGEDGYRSDLYALFAALVFAVHPVHVEAVASLFNRSEILVTIGGAGGLWWLLHQIDRHPARAWTGLAFAYLFALLSKENAAVLPGIAVALLVLLEPGGLLARIRKCLPVFWLLLPLALYFVLRDHALSTPPSDGAGQAVSGISRELAQSSLRSGDEILQIVGYLGQGLWLFIWPFPLRILYPAPGAVLITSAAVAQLALLITGLYRYRKGKPVLLASLAFYYIAMLPASRLINIDLAEPNLADRYLYFPSIAAAIVLAFSLNYLGKTRSRRAALVVVFLVLALLIPVSWARNAQWRSDVSLFETEYQRQEDDHNGDLLRVLTAAQVRQRNFKRVEAVCDRYEERWEKGPQFSMQCAIAYAALGREDDAVRAFRFATADALVAADAYSNLGRYYLRKGDPEEAARQFRMSVEAERIPHIREFREASMLIALYPRDREKLMEAKAHLEEALRIAPKFEMARDWLERLDDALQQGGNAVTPGQPSGPVHGVPGDPDGAGRNG